MTEFAYDVSGPLRPGGTLTVRNDGEEAHMMLMARLHDGVSLDDLLAALESDDESAAEALVDMTGAPGNSSCPGTRWRSPRPTSDPARTPWCASSAPRATARRTCSTAWRRR